MQKAKEDRKESGPGKYYLSKEFKGCFASALLQLHPLTKFKGLNVNKESKSRLPNPQKTTVDYADDLVMSVDELLNPEGDYCTTESWLKSRTRICATIEIIKRLGELGQPDLIIQCQDSLNAHSNMLLEQTGEPLQSYFTEWVKLTVLMHADSKSSDVLAQ